LSDLDWEKIDAIIFDMDGTLYKHNLVRLSMLWLLIIHIILGGWRDFLVLMHYRHNIQKISKIPNSFFCDVQFKATAKFFSISELNVQLIIYEWMTLRPLVYLKKYVYKDVDYVFKILRQKKIKIGIFSDYPVSEKISTLDLMVDALCSSTDRDIGYLKPNPSGLIKIIEQLGVETNRSLMIGDRLDRDYLCAKAAGVPFVLRTGDTFFTQLAGFLQGK
jgi:putative hydrolase of the HAD superfamily